MPYHWYPYLDQLHYYFSRATLIIALCMFALAIYIGLIRRRDVTRWYRRIVYAVTGFVVIQSILGLLMYAMGGRPYEEVHLAYGLGALLALPFFIFVETTAKKRPAMGSYMWAFALLVGIIIRTISTGAAG
jgi:heme A synthase